MMSLQSPAVAEGDAVISKFSLCRAADTTVTGAMQV